MTSTRPYLVRAMIDWIVDNAWTPYVVIAADAPGAEALIDYATDGRLVLNVSGTATRNLSIGKDDARRGLPIRRTSRAPLSAPIGSVVAVYARENQQGNGVRGGRRPYAPTEPEKPSRPKLSLVK